MQNQYDEWEWEFETVDEIFADILRKMERNPRYREVFLNPEHEKFEEFHRNVARLIRYNFLSPKICSELEAQGLKEEKEMARFLTEEIYCYMKKGR